MEQKWDKKYFLIWKNEFFWLYSSEIKKKVNLLRSFLLVFNRRLHLLNVATDFLNLHIFLSQLFHLFCRGLVSDFLLQFDGLVKINVRTKEIIKMIIEHWFLEYDNCFINNKNIVKITILQILKTLLFSW